MSAINSKRRINLPSEKEGFEKVVQDESNEKNDPDGRFYFSGTEKGDSPRVKQIRTLLKEGEPDTLSKYQRDKFESRLNEINDQLKKHMVPRRWMEQMPSKNGTQNYEFRKAVNAQVSENGEMSVWFNDLANERKNILMHLGRIDELSLESIRPEG